MMRDFARKTTDDIVEANYDTDKRNKIVEKVKQFFPTLGQVDEEVSHSVVLPLHGAGTHSLRMDPPPLTGDHEDVQTTDIYLYA